MCTFAGSQAFYMQDVTLISDWKQEDYYLGALQGGLVGVAALHVITNRINPFDVRMGAFVLRQVFARFPQGTIHILAVMAQCTDELPMSISYYRGHYFITVNDGRLSLLFDTPPQWVRAVLTAPSTFSEVDAYLKAVHALAENKLEERTLPTQMKTEVVHGVVAEQHYLIGQVIYIDSYGNAITNISRHLFDKTGGGRPFRIFVQGPYNTVTRISDAYGGVRPGELQALFNSAQLLELSLYMGNLATVESVSLYTEIQIQFQKQ